jgi:predicted regulator of Ras-like GTPase activity (Roadblock/LC7/MglB family)
LREVPVATIVEHLRMLRDVHGVYGSFVVAESGSLVDRDLPAAFDDALFADVGPRVARLFETFVSGGRDMETCVLRYADHKLYIRKMTWGIMGVLSSAAVNLPALRMVANLVVRRIDPEIAPLVSSRRPSPSKPPLLPSTPPVPVVAKAAIAPPPGQLAPHPRSSQPPSERTAPGGSVVAADLKDATPPGSDRHQRMYRGRPVGE